MGLWAMFGDGNGAESISSISPQSPEFRGKSLSEDIGDIGDSVSCLKTQLPASSPLPDYAAFCPGWWQKCFSCRDYLGPEHIRFCRAWNRRHYGSEVVALVSEEPGEAVLTEEMPVPKGGAWWNGRKSARL